MRVLIALLLLALAACATGPASLPEPPVAPDQLLARRTIGLDPAAHSDETLWLNPDLVMQYFVDLSTRDVSPDDVPVQLLRALREEWSTLNYNRHANLSASDAFHEQQANCLSFSAMVVSLMRHAGVRARFQRVESAPEWSLEGRSVVASLHVNAVIYQHGKSVEIDLLPSENQTGYERKFLLSDDEALAEWHSNLGTEALLANDLPLAFAELSRALRLAPAAAHIWVNLGAVYRRVGLNDEAESAWLIALRHDRRQLQALSNLQRLYEATGREEMAGELANALTYYRKQNPFYHYFLAQQAEREGDIEQALRHIQRAKSMHQDPRFEVFQARLQAALIVR